MEEGSEVMIEETSNSVKTEIYCPEKEEDNHNPSKTEKEDDDRDSSKTEVSPRETEEKGLAKKVSWILSKKEDPAMAPLPDIELGKIWRQLAWERKNKLFQAYGMDTLDPNFDWNVLREFIVNISDYFHTYVDRVKVIEIDVHDLWDELMLLAKVTPAHLPEQDKIVDIVLFAREQGLIHRWRHGMLEEAITSEGTILWTDLPFLVQDLKKTWFISQTDLDQVLRHNLAAFTARLCAKDICGNELAFCALWLLRKALETPRRVSRPYYRLRTSLVEMLPACVVWFQFCGYKLLNLSLDNLTFSTSIYFTKDDVKFTAPAKLAVKSGVEGQGFSLTRWVFWRERFGELCRCEDGEVAIMAKYGFDAMIRAEKQMEEESDDEDEYPDPMNDTNIGIVSDDFLEQVMRTMQGLTMDKNPDDSDNEVVDSGANLDSGID